MRKNEIRRGSTEETACMNRRRKDGLGYRKKESRTRNII